MSTRKKMKKGYFYEEGDLISSQEENSGEYMLELDSYITIQELLKRTTRPSFTPWTGEDGIQTPGYLDKIDAEEYTRQIQAKFFNEIEEKRRKNEEAYKESIKSSTVPPSDGDSGNSGNGVREPQVED